MAIGDKNIYTNGTTLIGQRPSSLRRSGSRYQSVVHSSLSLFPLSLSAFAPISTLVLSHNLVVYSSHARDSRTRSGRTASPFLGCHYEWYTYVL